MSLASLLPPPVPQMPPAPTPRPAGITVTDRLKGLGNLGKETATDKWGLLKENAKGGALKDVGTELFLNKLPGLPQIPGYGALSKLNSLPGKVGLHGSTASYMNKFFGKKTEDAVLGKDADDSGDKWPLPIPTDLFITNKINNTRIDLPVTPTEVSDEVQAQYDSVSVRGRSVSYLGYRATTDRKVSFSIKVYDGVFPVSENGKSDTLLEFVHKLKALEYPLYSEESNPVVPPNCYVNLYSGLKFEAVCTSVSVNWGLPIKGGVMDNKSYAYASISLSFIASSKTPYSVTDIENYVDIDKSHGDLMREGLEENLKTMQDRPQFESPNSIFNADPLPAPSLPNNRYDPNERLRPPRLFNPDADRPNFDPHGPMYYVDPDENNSGLWGF